MRTRTHRSLLTATAACTALLFTAAGCTSDEPAPKPPETTPSATPAPTEPAWGSKFNAKQTAQYEAALARWTEYEQRSEPIWADGKVTPAAEKLLKEYWVTWPTKLNTLRSYEADGVKVVGTPTVLRSEPSKVDIKGGGSAVVIKQCIDPTSISITYENGTAKPQKVGPYIRTVTLGRAKLDMPFLITGVEDITTNKDVTPCASQ